MLSRQSFERDRYLQLRQRRQPDPHGSSIMTEEPGCYPATHEDMECLSSKVEELTNEVREYSSRRKSLPLAATQDASGLLRARFESLAAAWRRETAFACSVLEMATDYSYQQIIGMGKPAIPFILEALSKEGDHWFWALKAITGHDPVAPQDRGDIEKMTQAWLIWGARNGYDF